MTKGRGKTTKGKGHAPRSDGDATPISATATVHLDRVSAKWEALQEAIALPVTSPILQAQMTETVRPWLVDLVHCLTADYGDIRDAIEKVTEPARRIADGRQTGALGFVVAPKLQPDPGSLWGLDRFITTRNVHGCSDCTHGVAPNGPAIDAGRSERASKAANWELAGLPIQAVVIVGFHVDRLFGVAGKPKRERPDGSAGAQDTDGGQMADVPVGTEYYQSYLARGYDGPPTPIGCRRNADGGLDVVVDGKVVGVALSLSGAGKKAKAYAATGSTANYLDPRFSTDGPRFWHKRGPDDILGTSPSLVG